MIARYLLPGLLAMLLAAGGWGWWQHRRAVDALARATAAEARVVGLQEAAAALDRHLRTVAAERDRWAAIAAEVDQLEGADEPLNAYGRAVLDRVRRAGP